MPLQPTACLHGTCYFPATPAHTPPPHYAGWFCLRLHPHHHYRAVGPPPPFVGSFWLQVHGLVRFATYPHLAHTPPSTCGWLVLLCTEHTYMVVSLTYSYHHYHHTFATHTTFTFYRFLHTPHTCSIHHTCHTSRGTIHTACLHPPLHCMPTTTAPPACTTTPPRTSCPGWCGSPATCTDPTSLFNNTCVPGSEHHIGFCFRPAPLFLKHSSTPV